MKKKIAYILTTAAIILAAFFIGRNTSPEPTKTDNGIDFYDADGNVYEWR